MPEDTVPYHETLEDPCDAVSSSERLRGQGPQRRTSRTTPRSMGSLHWTRKALASGGTPSCGPWSRTQNISATSEQRKEILRGLREWRHRTHAPSQFHCKRVYLKQWQVNSGRHSHIEQPTSALSWETSAFQSLPGYRARHHQCQYGAVCMDTDDQ